MLDTFIVQPFSLPVQDVSLSALVQMDQSKNNWDLTVVISRAPDQEPIQGSEVEAQLLTQDGVPLTGIERPLGALVEAGGSLSSSANAVFRFQNLGIMPNQLLVTYKNQTVQFQVLPQPSAREIEP